MTPINENTRIDLPTKTIIGLICGVAAIAFPLALLVVKVDSLAEDVKILKSDVADLSDTVAYMKGSIEKQSSATPNTLKTQHTERQTETVTNVPQQHYYNYQTEISNHEPTPIPHPTPTQADNIISGLETTIVPELEIIILPTPIKSLLNLL